MPYTCLSYTLKSGGLHHSESLDKYIGFPDGKEGISPEAYLWVVQRCRYGCSDHTGRYLGCVSLPNVSSVTQVVSLLNQGSWPTGNRHG